MGDDVAVAIFPCNQFGAQEPADDKSIKAFATGKGVDSPNAYVFAKGDVNGAKACETYQLVKGQTGMEIGWNFKGGFLVDKNGAIEAATDMGAVEQRVKDLRSK